MVHVCSRLLGLVKKLKNKPPEPAPMDRKKSRNPQPPATRLLLRDKSTEREKERERRLDGNEFLHRRVGVRGSRAAADGLSSLSPPLERRSSQHAVPLSAAAAAAVDASDVGFTGHQCNWLHLTVNQLNNVRPLVRR